MTRGISHFSIGETFEGYLLIKDVKKGVASNGKPFLTIFFKDSTGEIEAKLWEATREDEEKLIPEKIVYLTGDMTQFRGKSQLKVRTVRPTDQTDGVHISQFIEKAPVEKDVLQEKITGAIFEMENANIQRIVRAFVQKYQEALLTYPAASNNHHEYVSGLAHHIVSMLAIAKELCRLYPSLNKDLLYAGIILHDIGKLKELSGIITTTYTLEGKLLGHIPIMVDEIGQMAKELKIEGEEVVILQHMILSHHGKAEWGSPKPPLVQEAEILHFIDLIDAKMNMLNRALDKVNPGEFTERLFAMDNRTFYKPLFVKK